MKAFAHPTNAIEVVKEVEKMELAVLLIAKCILRVLMSTADTSFPYFDIGQSTVASAQPSKKTNTSSAPIPRRMKMTRI